MRSFIVIALFTALALCACTKYKTTTDLNNRKKPTTSSPIKKTFRSGVEICVVSINNGWAKLSDGTYVSSKYIQKVSKSSNTKKTGTKLDGLTFKHPAAKTSSMKSYTLWATGYYTPVFNAGGSYALRTLKGSPLAYLSNKQWCTCAMEGSCAVKSGSKVITYNYAGKSSSYTVNCKAYYPSFSDYHNCKIKFQKATGIYGDGSAFNLVPFRSIAVDKSRIPYGTVLYIPKARGTKVTLPDGTTRVHDGYFIAADTGGAIKGNHIDVFFGTTDPVKKNVFSSWVKSTSKGTFKAYKVTDSKIINEIKNFSKGFKN